MYKKPREHLITLPVKHCFLFDNIDLFYLVTSHLKVSNQGVCMIKKISIFLILFVTSLSTITPQGNPFQGDFDFDQFLAELEGALAKIEEEEKTKQPGSMASAFDTAAPTDLITEVIKQPQQAEQNKDPESLFISPIMQKITLKTTKQQKTEPTKESLSAYSKIMEPFVKDLESVQNKVHSIKHLSPSFKDEFTQLYAPIINAISIAHKQIESKKAYKQLFLAPPEANKTLQADLKKVRQSIVNTAKKIKKLNDQLVISTKDEEKEISQDVLQQLASLPPAEEMVGTEPVQRRKSRRKGKEKKAEKKVAKRLERKPPPPPPPAFQPAAFDFGSIK